MSARHWPRRPRPRQAHPGGAPVTRQPKAVWAVAFACVVAFMGIGLVDPILPALASQLDASPSQVELLFRATSPSRASPCSSRALRFASGAIASFLAGKLAEGVSLEAPFLVGAGAVLLALATLLAGRRHLAAAEWEPVPAQLQLAIDEEPAGAIALERRAA